MKPFHLVFLKENAKQDNSKIERKNNQKYIEHWYKLKKDIAKKLNPGENENKKLEQKAIYIKAMIE